MKKYLLLLSLLFFSSVASAQGDYYFTDPGAASAACTAKRASLDTTGGSNCAHWSQGKGARPFAGDYLEVYHFSCNGPGESACFGGSTRNYAYRFFVIEEPPPPQDCPPNGIAGYFGNGAATCDGSCTIERIGDGLVGGGYPFAWTGAPCEEANTQTECQWGSRPDGSCYPHTCPFGDCDQPDDDPEPPEESCPAGQNWGSINGFWGCWGSSNDCPSGTSGGTVNGEFICYPDPGNPQGCPSGTTPGTVQGVDVCYPDDYEGPGDGGDNGDGDGGGDGPGDGDGDGPGDGDGKGPGDGDGDGPGDGNGPGGPGGPGDGSASGGAQCGSPPTCSGDEIQCAILMQQYLQRCPAGEGIGEFSPNEYTLDIEQRTQDAIDEYQQKFDEIKDQFSQLLGASFVGAGGGLQSNVQDIYGATVELGIVAREDIFNWLRAIIFFAFMLASFMIIMRAK